jgi:Protein of unknown function (DUF1573)
MFRLNRNASFILPLLASAVLSGAKIEFDAKTIDCGKVFEGKTEKLNAVFTVKNTGDSLLRLDGVRPGCGCTVVKYDTLIPAGKTAKIESHVNIAGFRSGPISKFITVTSNATNEPSVRLTIEATVRATIDVSESFISLDDSYARNPRVIYLTSLKKDLKVSGVSFISKDNSKSPARQTGHALSIKYAWAPTDSVTPDGSRVFKMGIFMPDIENPTSGDFIIKTNHADKPEIDLQGALNK